MSRWYPSPSSAPDELNRQFEAAISGTELDELRDVTTRQLDVRCDLTLDVVHQVLQVAFDWTNSHLHRFALGGDPFDAAAEWFLCPYDVEEADEGAAASTVRLDGRRAAPPEACGSLRTAAELAEVLDDPAHFDVAEVNASFRAPFFALMGSGVPSRFVEMVHQLSFNAPLEIGGSAGDLRLCPKHQGAGRLQSAGVLSTS